MPTATVAADSASKVRTAGTTGAARTKGATGTTGAAGTVGLPGTVGATGTASAAAAAMPASCPLRDVETFEAHRTALQAGSDLSLRIKGFLRAKDPEDLGTWLHSVMEQSRVVFQPWCMEILFTVGVLDDVRFSQLQSILGTSSRTLSDKLQALTQAGFMERVVEPGPPLKVHYKLTKGGRATVAAGSPLFSHLNHTAVMGRRNGQA